MARGKQHTPDQIVSLLGQIAPRSGSLTLHGDRSVVFIVAKSPMWCAGMNVQCTSFLAFGALAFPPNDSLACA
jgi:hypothetical protein